MRERYLQTVRSLLDCPSEARERLLFRLNNAVTTFFEDYPEASEEDLIANFGMPEDCAARLLDECAPAMIVAGRQKRDRFHHILTTVLVVVLSVAVSLSVYLWSNGGLVIIHTDNKEPDFWGNLPASHITYDYNN